jgi:hypothetical protein
MLEDTLLEHDTISLEKREERNRLSNMAHGQLSALAKESYTKDQMSHDLMVFLLETHTSYGRRAMGLEVVGQRRDPNAVFQAGQFWPVGSGVIMFAPPDSGKTWLAMTLAVSVNSGINQVWLVKAAKVLFVNLERDQRSAEHRLALINRALGLAEDTPLLMLNAKGATLMSLVPAIKATMAEHGAEVLFLDSISRTGGGTLVGDEVANGVMDTLNALCPTWCAIAHSPRDDSSHVYGSVMFDGAADVIMQVTAEQRGLVLGTALRVTKANDIQKPPLQMLAWHFGEEAGDTVLQQIRQASKDEFPEASHGERFTIHDACTLYLKENSQGTASEIAEVYGVSRTNVSTYLNGNPSKFVKLLKQGKEQPYGLFATIEQ